MYSYFSSTSEIQQAHLCIAQPNVFVCKQSHCVSHHCCWRMCPGAIVALKFLCSVQMWFTDILSYVRGGHEPVVFVLVCLDASWSAAFALWIHFVQRLEKKRKLSLHFEIY